MLKTCSKKKLIVAILLVMLPTFIIASSTVNPVSAKTTCKKVLGYVQYCINTSKKTCKVELIKAKPKKEPERSRFNTARLQAQKMCDDYNHKQAAQKKAEEAKKKAEEAKKKAEADKKKSEAENGSSSGTSAKTDSSGDSSSTTNSSSPTSICENGNISEEVRAAAGCSEDGGTLDNAISTILKGIILILGVVAVIFIVYGGVGYMTSAGDAGKVKKARETILYAVIGLIVCARSYAIVNFAIADLLSKEKDNKNAYTPALVQNDIAFFKK